MVSREMVVEMLQEVGCLASVLPQHRDSIAVTHSNVMLGFRLDLERAILKSWTSNTSFELADPDFPEKLRDWLARGAPGE